MKEIIDRLRVAAGEADGAYAYPFAEIAKVDAAAILTALKAGQALVDAERTWIRAAGADIIAHRNKRADCMSGLLDAFEATP